MKICKPKKWLTYFRMCCLFCACILINGISLKYERENIISLNENFNKDAEKVILEENKEIVKSEAVKEITEIKENISAGKYISNPAKGFSITTNNIVYNLNYDDYVLVAAVIASEANKSSIDDILAVSSVILNRADGGKTPVEVVTAKNQFSGYHGGYYLRYIDESGNLTNVPEYFEEIIHDALNGIRNNVYYSFNSWSTSNYSENYIIEKGNRYK